MSEKNPLFDFSYQLIYTRRRRRHELKQAFLVIYVIMGKFYYAKDGKRRDSGLDRHCHILYYPNCNISLLQMHVFYMKLNTESHPRRFLC